MNCVRIEQIYLYLEKELPPSESKKIEEHLSSCLKCSKALEERRLLLRAAESLPAFNVPPDFTQKVMAKIFPPEVSLFGWLAALAAAFSSMIVALLIFVLIINQSLPRFLLSFTHTLGNSIKNIALVFVKFYKFVSLAFKLLQQFSQELFKGLSLLTTIISPEVQIIIITITLILVFSFAYGVRRKFFAGEKQ
jgi:hypothetical protein